MAGVSIVGDLRGFGWTGAEFKVGGLREIITSKERSPAAVFLSREEIQADRASLARPGKRDSLTVQRSRPYVPNTAFRARTANHYSNDFFRGFF